MPVSNFDIQVL